MMPRADVVLKPKSQAEIVVLIQHALWRQAWPHARRDIRRVVRMVLDYTKSADADIAIVLCNNAHITPLNNTYRGKPVPTNVLSFPADEPGQYGDVLLAYEYIMHEATAQNKSFIHHAMHMVVHGVLHLLGYDHLSDEEAEQMEALEVEILARLSIANPYQLR